MVIGFIVAKTVFVGFISESSILEGFFWTKMADLMGSRNWKIWRICYLKGFSVLIINLSFIKCRKRHICWYQGPNWENSDECISLQSSLKNARSTKKVNFRSFSKKHWFLILVMSLVCSSERNHTPHRQKKSRNAIEAKSHSKSPKTALQIKNLYSLYLISISSLQIKHSFSLRPISNPWNYKNFHVIFGWLWMGGLRLLLSNRALKQIELAICNLVPKIEISQTSEVDSVKQKL